MLSSFVSLFLSPVSLTIINSFLDLRCSHLIGQILHRLKNLPAHYVAIVRRNIFRSVQKETTPEEGAEEDIA